MSLGEDSAVAVWSIDRLNFFPLICFGVLGCRKIITLDTIVEHNIMIVCRK